MELVVSSDNWESLSTYESYELVKQDYAERHGEIPGERHAREIAARFSHARSYFCSANSSELNVKPLLLYYGVVNLARGLTLMLSRGLREIELIPSHGLSVAVKEWTAEMSKDAPDFSALQIEVRKTGSFVQLAEATVYKSLLRANSSAVNLTEKNPPFSSGASLSLADILSRLPALQRHYRRWRGETRCAMLKTEKIDQNDEQVRIRLTKGSRHTWITKQDADELFWNTEFEFESETQEHIVFIGPDDQQELPGLTDYRSHAFPRIGDLWLTALYPGGLKLSKISTLFALSYVLGMLVRYYPMQWTALIRGQFADAAFPTLAASVELLEYDFTQIVVDFLAPPPEA